MENEKAIIECLANEIAKTNLELTECEQAKICISALRQVLPFWLDKLGYSVCEDDVGHKKLIYNLDLAIAVLERQEEETFLHSMSFQHGAVDMDLIVILTKQFMTNIIEFLKQNGAKSFFNVSTDRDNERYRVIVEKLEG